jgi:hypothetical protein
MWLTMDCCHVPISAKGRNIFLLHQIWIFSNALSVVRTWYTPINFEVKAAGYWIWPLAYIPRFVAKHFWRIVLWHTCTMVWYLSTGSSLALLPSHCNVQFALKDSVLFANQNWYFPSSPNIQQKVSIEWARSVCNFVLQLQLHIPRWTACLLYSSVLQYLRILYQKPIPMSMLRRKLPSTALKCEKGNNLKLQHIYSPVLWQMKTEIFYVSNTEAVRILQIFSQVFWRVYEAYVMHKRRTKFGIIS